MTGRTRAALRWAGSPAGIIALGVLVRLLHILTRRNRYYFGDTAEYEAAAIRLLHGQGLDHASPRAPLFSAFMAFGFLIGGEGNFVVVRLLKLVLATALMIVTTRLATRIGGRPAGTIAAIAIAFAPTLAIIVELSDAGGVARWLFV